MVARYPEMALDDDNTLGIPTELFEMVNEETGERIPTNRRPLDGSYHANVRLPLGVALPAALQPYVIPAPAHPKRVFF